jgi:hypothetical protein
MGGGLAAQFDLEGETRRALIGNTPDIFPAAPRGGGLFCLFGPQQAGGINLLQLRGKRIVLSKIVQ